MTVKVGQLWQRKAPNAHEPKNKPGPKVTVNLVAGKVVVVRYNNGKKAHCLVKDFEENWKLLQDV